MPEVVNTSFLGDVPENETDANANAETMIKVDNVSMVFNMASETMTNLKEYAIALARRELHFKEFRALDHISLEVKKGDVFGILGTNGSGKSTLLKIIAGVLEPTEGTCTVHGSIAPLIELGAGFDMELTARENIYLNGALLGYPKKFIDQHFDEIVDFAEVEQFLDMPLKNYSSGMVARIAFAIATVIIPDILIVDEVLSVGDFMFQQKCERRINALIKEHGVTVLIVSHSNEQIERLCNKAIWIEKGHERIQGNAQEVCQVYRMLGGHFGSPEAEQRIFDLITTPLEENDNLIETFAGETRYSTPIKILEATPSNAKKEHIILAPGMNHTICILANTLSSLDLAPVLLTRTDGLPELVEQELRQTRPHHITILDINKSISQQVFDEIGRVTPESVVIVISEPTPERLAYAVYQEGKKSGWGEKALLTYHDGLGDMLCFLPYAYRHKCPILFIQPTDDAGIVAKDVATDLINDNFNEILILGIRESLDDADISEELKAKIPKQTRFRGKDPFDANTIINRWIAEHDESARAPKQLFFAPIWNPADLLCAGILTLERNAIILVEDTQNLDSVSHNLDEVAKHKDTVKKLVFFGDETQFSKLDKELLARMLTKEIEAK